MFAKLNRIAMISENDAPLYRYHMTQAGSAP